MPEPPAGGARGDGGAPRPVVTLESPQFQVRARRPRRAEKVAASAFVVALAGFAAFGGAYWQGANNEWLGGTLGVGFVAFGVAFVVWGKYLMPRGPFEEPRPMMAVTPDEREALVADFASRGKVAIRRRTFLLKLMGLAAGVFGVVAAFPLLRSLGPLPRKSLYKTKWRKGSYLTTIDGRRVRTSDVAVGGILTVFPEDDVGGAISQTVLIHVQEGGDIVTRPGRETWGPDGFLAFSKVCTHAGCPVGLYEELTEQLLCPCHQSLFDVRAGCWPVFGPAPRPLPQLPLYVDSAGYLRAQAGYDEPVGPGFWERGGTT
ncbi:MAG TPA: Rieske 2Fe-2S domain-containing protein [Acidimicrobiales bacterium]|jgi:ubiquinol-cytochrome c reductase iron-sulfur subunit|nr:Rieske 2Fe-2S domain-containing protein [Acidimicrobiales bacterium]